MEMKFANIVPITGYVTNFVVRTLGTGREVANIGIKDELTNNSCYVSLFGREGLKYGETPVTLKELYNIFMNSNGEPRHVLVTLNAKVAENKYISKKSGQEVVSQNITAFNIAPCSDPAKQRIIFRMTGIVDSIKESGDGNEYKIRLGILTKNRDKQYAGIEYNNLVVRDDCKLALEDKGIERFAMIDVAGSILNRREYDYYGMPQGTVREIRIESVGKVTTEDRLDDIETYKLIKSGKYNPDEAAPFKEDTSVKKAEKTDDELLAELGL